MIWIWYDAIKYEYRICLLNLLNLWIYPRGQKGIIVHKTLLFQIKKKPRVQSKEINCSLLWVQVLHFIPHRAPCWVGIYGPLVHSFQLVLALLKWSFDHVLGAWLWLSPLLVERTHSLGLLFHLLNIPPALWLF